MVYCFHVPPTQFPLLLTSYMDLFVTFNEPISAHYYYLQFIVYSDFLSFCLLSFLCPRSPSSIPHYIQLSCLLMLLQAVTLSQIFLILITLTFWEVLVTIFGNIYLSIYFMYLNVFFRLLSGLISNSPRNTIHLFCQHWVLQSTVPESGPC